MENSSFHRSEGQWAMSIWIRQKWVMGSKSLKTIALHANMSSRLVNRLGSNLPSLETGRAEVNK